MKNKITKEKISEIIAMLFIVLFTYAAITKLIDLENFKIQIGQSPLLSAYTEIVAVGVPITEIFIVVLLFLPKWRVTGLYFSFLLMTCFTTYIYIILNYSEFIPCSCGGILEKMDWKQHLIFNISCIIMALSAVILSKKTSNHWLHGIKRRNFILTMLATSCAGILLIILLYFSSENLMHTNNSFIRRFPTHAQPEYNKINLGHNSYYFAGISGDKIYLGNRTAPQIMTIIDTSFSEKKQTIIKVEDQSYKFLDPQVAVYPPHFYLFDGLAPCIFTGDTDNWYARFITDSLNRATAILPLKSGNFALRTTSLASHSNTLKIFSSALKVQDSANFVLPGQTDGIFDTDGMLLYNEQIDKLFYIYFYRNQYLIFNNNLYLESTFKTIDTVSIATVKIVKKISGESQMAKPPLYIHKNAATYYNLLFIQSDRIGKYEDAAILKHATMIDIYDTYSSKYLNSIYVYKVNDNKLKSFRVHDNKLYTISGSYLSVIKIEKKNLAQAK